MPTLAAQDLRAILDLTYELHGDTSDAEMPTQVLTQLGDLVGCESVSYSRVEHITPRLLSSANEPREMDLSGLAGFHALFDQHPGFAAYRSGRLMLGTSIALSDLIDLPTLRRLPLYADFYRPRGTHDQLLCVVELGLSRLPCWPSTERGGGSHTVTGRSRRSRHAPPDPGRGPPSIFGIVDCCGARPRPFQ
jgi:hypothetical protein